MNPERIEIPEEHWFYRGNRWDAKITFSRDVSAYDFLLQFKANRFGDVVVAATIDDTEAGGVAPFYILFSVAGTLTAPITEDRLEADLQVNPDETWLRWTIPVKGQISEIVSA